MSKIMKDAEIYNKWHEFITSDEYKKYFGQQTNKFTVVFKIFNQ